jgi:hypothetical protein
MKRKPEAPGIPAFEDLGEKQLRGLGQQLDRLSDANGYKHGDLLRKHTDEPEALAWHLVRHGLAAAPMQSAGLLRVLADGARRWASAADVIALLRRLPDDLGTLDRGQAAKWKWTMLTPGMLANVDPLVVHAYLADPAAVLAARAELGENVRRAIDFVRLRAGEEIPADSAAEIFEFLVDRHCDSGLGGCDVPRIVDGARVERQLQDSAAVGELAGLFAAGTAWGEAVLEWVLRRVREFRPYVDTMCDRVMAGLRLARLADVIYLFGDGIWSARTLLQVLDARGDAPAQLFAAADRLAREGLAPFKVAAAQVPEKKEPRGSSGGYEDDEDDEEDGGGDDEDYGDDEGEYDAELDGGDEEEDEDDEIEAVEPGPDDDHVRGLAEALVIVGIERLGQQAAPAELDVHFTLARVYESEQAYIGRLRGVLTRLGPARAHAVVRRVLEQRFWFGRAAAIADIHFDAGLVREVLARIDQGDYGVDVGLMAVCDAVTVPLVAEQALRAPGEKHAAAWQEALLELLARASAAGEAWPPAWDEYIHLERVRFSSGQSKVEPVLAMLGRLPLARHEQVLRTNMRRCAEEPWRLCHCLRADTPPALMEEVFAAVLAERKSVKSGTLAGSMTKLGMAPVEPLLRAFGATPAENMLMKELERALEWKAFERFKESLGRPIETKEQELRRLADALPGPKVRVYRLTRGEDAPGDEAVGRIGGEPRGVASPPEHGGEPMTHVITLDLALLPELGSEYPEARALSLYLPDPDQGEAHEDGELVWTREDELGRADGSTDGAAALIVEGFDVPAAIFAGDVEGDLKRVRQLLYSSSGYALGGPLWLQDGDEGLDPDFLLQFDESLCHINLGDMGVMYVFGGSISWQCH